MWLVGALSSIGSSPTHLAVRHSPAASAHFAPDCSSWLSYSPFPPGSFSSSLSLPTRVQRNEPHPPWIRKQSPSTSRMRNGERYAYKTVDLCPGRCHP